MEYVIIVTKENEADEWIAENSELPIVLEDKSSEKLMESVKDAAPEMAELNGLTKPTSLYFSIQAMVKVLLPDWRQSILWPYHNRCAEKILQIIFVL